MTEPLCAICGLDHDIALQRLKAHSDGLTATSEALLAELRIRAEAAEKERDSARDDAMAGAAAAARECARAEAAEAEAALAWRRVTELQERGTQLLVERRAADARCADLVRELRQWQRRAYRDGSNATSFAAIIERYEAKL